MMRDEQALLPQALLPALPLIDNWTIVDTGSSDASVEVARQLMHGIPGELHRREWRGFGENRNELLELARGSADWLLLLDADMRPQIHHGLKEWLADDPDPEVQAWLVPIEEAGTTWSLPLLVRGHLGWAYNGATHEYLDTGFAKTRHLVGLQIEHLRGGGGGDPQARLEENLRLLAPGVEAGDPRAIFYTAESLRYLGRNEEAAHLYARRAEIDSFEEEAWYAEYQAARLCADRQGLLLAWNRRPWRHEPLSELARLVASEPNEDVLFKEPLGG